VSEILALTRTSFQVERGVVAVVTLKRRRHHVREIPIPAELMQALNQHFNLDASESSGVRLWIWHRTTAWRLVKATMHRSMVTGRPASPRGFRHAFGVGALQAGAPLSLVQRWLGHSRLSTTAIYADVSGPEERAFAERFWSNDLSRLKR
jgi:site-specific recombinase XerD